MTSDFWFPFYPGLYKQKTLHLTAEQDGVYRRLIDHYMESAQPLPENINAISRIAGVSSDSDAIRIALAFFTHKKGIGYTHQTCDKVLSDMYEKHVKRKGAAKAGATARWKKIDKIQSSECESHPISNADAMRENAIHTHRINKVGKPTLLPADLIFDFAQFWDGWKSYEMTKGSKSDAMKSYNKTRKEVDHATLIRSRDQYCRNCEKLACKTKHVASWLNGRGWESDDAHGEIATTGGMRSPNGYRAKQPTVHELVMADRTYRRDEEPPIFDFGGSADADHAG